MFYASNIAHVEGGTGTFVMPAHSPYDRQILREQVERLASRGTTLTLGMHGTRWLVTRRTAAGSRCTTCTNVIGRLSCSRADEAAVSCIDCAMQPGTIARMEGPQS